MMRLRALSAFIAVWVLVANAPAQGAQEWLGARVGTKVWFSQMTGDVKAEGALLPASKIDFEKDLNMDGSAVVMVPEITINVGTNALSFEGWVISSDGAKTLNETFNFGDKQYIVNTRVDSALDVQYLGIHYSSEVYGASGIHVSAMLGVDIIRVDAELDNALVGKETETATAPLPVVGLGVEVQMPYGTSFMADVSGLGVSAGSLLDVKAGLAWRPIPSVDLNVGYRLFTIDADTDDMDANYTLSGLTLGAGLKF